MPSPFVTRRGRLVLGAALSLLALGAPAGMAAAASPGAATASGRLWPTASWQIQSDGNIYESSPTTARVNGTEVIAVGTETGEVELLNAATGAELPGWPREVAHAPGQPAAVESSPTIAYLDGPGAPPSIIVGTGSTAVDHGHSVGEVEAFRLSGTVRFVFHVGSQPNTASGVISSPAVGDITGNGQSDIVFGSWDHNLYALTASGKLVPGFPYNNKDTVWSSPALAHVRGAAGQDDIFIGSDASGSNRCFGGFISDFTYAKGAPRVVWQHCEPQTIWSSPAIGVLNASGRKAVVVGTGFGDTTYLPGTADIYAYYAGNGATVPGWPVHTAGPTPGSPAIGIGPGGKPMVAATSWSCDGTNEKSCFYSNSSLVEAWTGSGALLSKTSLSGATALGSPILVPLLGGPSDDIVVGAAAGLYAISPLASKNGGDPYLFGLSKVLPIFNQCSIANSPALADVPGTSALDGWHVIEACGGPASMHEPGEIASYRLPVQPRDLAGIWPMFRGGPSHLGGADA